MADIPRQRRPADDSPPPSKEECWDEFWEVIVDAIAEAKIREAREQQ